VSTDRTTPYYPYSASASTNLTESCPSYGQNKQLHGKLQRASAGGNKLDTYRTLRRSRHRRRIESNRAGKHASTGNREHEHTLTTQEPTHNDRNGYRRGMTTRQRSGDTAAQRQEDTLYTAATPRRQPEADESNNGSFLDGKLTCKEQRQRRSDFATGVRVTEASELDCANSRHLPKE
jgi:hypothetical protein